MVWRRARKAASKGPSLGKKYTSGIWVAKCHNTRVVFACLPHRRIFVFARAAILGSGAPPPNITTRKRSGSMRATTSFTVRFWALVLSSSAKEGVNTVTMQAAQIRRTIASLLTFSFHSSRNIRLQDLPPKFAQPSRHAHLVISGCNRFLHVFTCREQQPFSNIGRNSVAAVGDLRAVCFQIVNLLDDARFHPHDQLVAFLANR